MIAHARKLEAIGKAADLSRADGLLQDLAREFDRFRGAAEESGLVTPAGAALEAAAIDHA